MTSDSNFSIDFHVHTSYSYDCPMPPRLVIELARLRGLNGIAITDHDCVEGALATIDANHYPDFLVIPGIEVKSHIGDVIGLYVDKPIKSHLFEEVIQEIHELGGIVYLPHPMRTFSAARMPAIHAKYEEIDFWEMYNGRYSEKEFADSRDIFGLLDLKPRLCGSDAHMPWDIGAFRTVLPSLPRDPKLLFSISGEATLEANPRSDVAVSAGISLGAITKSFKRGDYRKVGRSAAGLPWKAVKKLTRIIAAQSVKNV